MHPHTFTQGAATGGSIFLLLSPLFLGLILTCVSLPSVGWSEDSWPFQRWLIKVLTIFFILFYLFSFQDPFCQISLCDAGRYHVLVACVGCELEKGV